MKALKIESFGAPSEGLKYVDVEDTPLGAKEARVRIEVAGINPSDVGNINGAKIRSELAPLFEGGVLGPILQKVTLWRMYAAYERVASSAPGKVVLLMNR
jgi:NADPH:quinone reductase-like Zn-dependent oxidoreductase